MPPPVFFLAATHQTSTCAAVGLDGLFRRSFCTILWLAAIHISCKYRTNAAPTRLSLKESVFLSQADRMIK